MHSDRIIQTPRNSILTASSVLYHLDDPESWDGSMSDVARGLSNTCRWGGQIPQFYSVAEHCIFVARYLMMKGESRELQLVGLLHDAHEAFYGDIPTPLKNLLSGYEGLTDGFDRVIAEQHQFDSDLFYSDKVKEADRAVGNWEQNIFSAGKFGIMDEITRSFRMINYAPAEVYTKYLDLYLDLAGYQSYV